ncbi:MAG: glycosyltransferase [Verrucomicrobia bacterium]|nr:glycosyltransferase [Verrucomicrobiota bacterium]
MNPLSATLAICTHNGEARLPDVLQALLAQTAPPNTWEVVVIDNASTDQTGEVCKRYADRHLPVRVAREERPGLSYARARAAREARAPIVCFLDDDNIPDARFVHEAIALFATTPKMGVAGSRVIPRWQSPPSALALAVADFALAICDIGDTPAQITGRAEGVVGAGLCVRTALLAEIHETLLSKTGETITDRKGQNLIGGGDTAICILAQQRGHECWYQPALRIEHIIPDSRTHPEYLKRLYAGIGRGQACLRGLTDSRARHPLMRRMLATKDFARYIKKRLGGPDFRVSAYDEITTDSMHELEMTLIWARAKQLLK